jgi:TonB family protein
MTRTAALAVLLLSPLMVHASASSPAQPQAATGMPALHASVKAPQGFMLAAASNDDKVAGQASTVRVSTGVVAPKLIHTEDLHRTVVSTGDLTAATHAAVVEMVVDEKGKPSGVKILQSAGPGYDQDLLTSVSKYRFQPGTLDGQAAAVPVKLEITIQAEKQ